MKADKYDEYKLSDLIEYADLCRNPGPRVYSVSEIFAEFHCYNLKELIISAKDIVGIIEKCLEILENKKKVCDFSSDEDRKTAYLANKYGVRQWKDVRECCYRVMYDEQWLSSVDKYMTEMKIRDDELDKSRQKTEKLMNDLRSNAISYMDFLKLNPRDYYFDSALDTIFKNNSIYSFDEFMEIKSTSRVINDFQKQINSFYGIKDSSGLIQLINISDDTVDNINAKLVQFNDAGYILYGSTEQYLIMKQNK